MASAEPHSRRLRPSAGVVARARRIRLLLLDVDGVLTGGWIVLDHRGRQLRVFHLRDSHGIALLLRAGIRVAWLSARRSAVVTRHARDLQVSATVQGVASKLVAARRLWRRWHLDPEEVAFIGDELLDQPLFASVGLAIAVADGAAGLDRHVHWTTAAPGGAGAAREVAEMLLRAQGRWASVLGDAMR
jgi:3-deoxy-D-manno-octulosonate 8-phosphate phosphatase (KDO 8-P phosphatase)